MMTCNELGSRNSSQCIGCYICTENLGERETLILRYFAFEQNQHNHQPSKMWLKESDFAYRHRTVMLLAVSPYLPVEKSSIYRSVTRLQQMKVIRRPEILEGRQSEFAATAKGDRVYRLKRLLIHGIDPTRKIEPFRHEYIARLSREPEFDPA